VRALPLGVAAERGVHYFCDYFSFFLFLSLPHTFLPEGAVLGFLHFALSLKPQRNEVFPCACEHSTIANE
jgi:hypothetical protein